MAKRLILEFPDDETRMAFVGWYLDGTGEQDFGLTREEGGKPFLYSSPPKGQEQWDWQTKPDDDEYLIRIGPEE